MNEYRKLLHYQAVRTFNTDWVKYIRGEIVEITKIIMVAFGDSEIYFKGRTGFEDMLLVKDFRKMFIQDIKVDDKTNEWNTKRAYLMEGVNDE